MWSTKRSKSSPASPVTREVLDGQLQQALDLVRAGDRVAAVRSVEALADASGETSLFGQACYNAALINLFCDDVQRGVRWLRTAAEAPAPDQQSQKDRLTYLMNLGDVLTNTGQLIEAEEVLRAGLEQRRGFYPPDHPGVAFGLHPLAANLLAQGRADEAVPLVADSVRINAAAGQPELAHDLALYAYCAQATGEGIPPLDGWEGWSPALQVAVGQEIVHRARAADTPGQAALAVAVLGSLSSLLDGVHPRELRLNVEILTADTGRIAGDGGARVAGARRALALLGPDEEPAVQVDLWDGLAMALAETGALAEADTAYRDALTVATTPHTRSTVLRNFGLWRAELEDFEQAEPLLAEAVAAAAQTGDAELHGRALTAHGIFVQHRGRLEQAAGMLQRGVDTLPVAHPDRFCAMSHLIALQQGRDCPCDSEASSEAASAIVEEIVRRSAPAGLLESITIGGGEHGDGVDVRLAREPTEEELASLQQLVDLALGEIRSGMSPGRYPA